jgi:hypothetical protein
MAAQPDTHIPSTVSSQNEKPNNIQAVNFHGNGEDNAHSNVILPFGTTQNFSLNNKHSRNCGASENGNTIKLAKKASFHS